MVDDRVIFVSSKIILRIFLIGGENWYFFMGRVVLLFLYSGWGDRCVWILGICGFYFILKFNFKIEKE